MSSLERRIIRAQFLIQGRRRCFRPRHDPTDLESLDAVVGDRVGAAHVAGTDAENTDGWFHKNFRQSGESGYCG